MPWLLRQANVIHQCGPDDLASLREHTAGLSGDLAARYLLTGYVGPELADVLALADVVISRGGAGTIAELTALGTTSVLVPLVSSAGKEQVHNARHLTEAAPVAAHRHLDRCKLAPNSRSRPCGSPEPVGGWERRRPVRASMAAASAFQVVVVVGGTHAPGDGVAGHDE